ncbi:MAG: hypothetical protein JWQ96_1315 [Segetibacter sp.]|nr:hypothetical protein [Segetibacter sp.]
MVAYINNTFINEEEASLHVSDLSIQRGYAVFDYFRIRDNVPLFLDDYIDRFFNSASGLVLTPLQSKQELKEVVYKMISLNNIPDSGFRLILTGGFSLDSYQPVAPNFIILQQRLELPTEEKFQKGVRVVLHEYMRQLPLIKSTNYIIGIQQLEKLRQKKADDILYHLNGQVLEFPRSNVFIVTADKTIVTPEEDVLKGITRMKVIELAEKDFKVELRRVSLTDLNNAAEVFMTSTTKRVFPIVAIDDKQVGNGSPGEITTALYHSFLQLEEQILKDEKVHY